MSAEHVDAMNALLEQSDEVRVVCSTLPQSRTLAYDLTDGPDGADVHWAMTFTDTVRFSFGHPAEPDVVISGDWASIIRRAKAGRTGDSVPDAMTISDPAGVLAEIGPAFAVAQSVATIPADLPEV